MNHFDAIVLGAGGVGSAAMMHLARRGVRVLGIDRFVPPHDRGSSHGQTRVIRQAYFEHPDYVPLVLESYGLWAELEQQTGRRLYFPTGLVEIGPPDGIVVPGVLRAAEEHGLAVELLPGSEVSDRWPALRAPEGMVAAVELQAGYLRVEESVRAHLSAAVEMGAELRPEVTVHGWKATGGDVEVTTSGGRFTAGRLIVTAGAWAGPMLADLGLKLEIRRKSLFWFGVDDANHATCAELPVFLFELPEGILYGFPQVDPRGMKVGEHSGGRPVEDPLTVDRTLDVTEQQMMIDFLARCVPVVSDRCVDHTVCLYTMTPDEHFVVDLHPQHANVVFAAGLSGHGFKFAPVLGRALADLALEGCTELPIGFLSLGRFGGVG